MILQAHQKQSLHTLFYLSLEEENNSGVPIVAQWLTIRLGTMRLRVRSLASLSGLRIWCCHELRCRLQTWLGSGVAVDVVQADGYSSHSTPSLGTSICCKYGPKKTHIPKKSKQGRQRVNLIFTSRIQNNEEFPSWLRGNESD